MRTAFRERIPPEKAVLLDRDGPVVVDAWCGADGCAGLDEGLRTASGERQKSIGEVAVSTQPPGQSDHRQGAFDEGEMVGEGPVMVAAVREQLSVHAVAQVGPHGREPGLAFGETR